VNGSGNGRHGERKSYPLRVTGHRCQQSRSTVVRPRFRQDGRAVFETGPADSWAFGPALAGQAGPIIWKPALRGAGRAYSLKACGLSKSLRAALHI